MKNIFNKKKFLENKRGSVLVYSLFIMAISLIIGISLMSTSSISRKSSLSTTKSINAFQVADSGLEYALMKIRDYKVDQYGYNLPYGTGWVWSDSDTLYKVFGSKCDDSSGIVKDNAGDGDFELYFYDEDDNRISSCTDSSARITKIRKIKVIGQYNNITRSIETTMSFVPAP